MSIRDAEFAVERLWFYQAAQVPTLSSLVSLGKRQKSPVR